MCCKPVAPLLQSLITAGAVEGASAEAGAATGAVAVATGAVAADLEAGEAVGAVLGAAAAVLRSEAAEEASVEEGAVVCIAATNLYVELKRTHEEESQRIPVLEGCCEEL